MSLNPALREKLIRDTRDAGAAFLEDLDHMRQTAALASSRRECRHISAILRRLLVEDDLRSIATPRIGRIMIPARDNAPVVRFGQASPLSYYALGGRVFGGDFGSVAMWPQTYAPPKQIPGDSAQLVGMNIDAFLSQKTLYMDRQWASRRQIIKYIANEKSGVHSGSGEAVPSRLLSRLELSATYDPTGGPDGLPMMTFHNTSTLPPIVSATYARDVLNPVLVEVFAAAHLLANAPDVLKLEGVLRQELA